MNKKIDSSIAISYYEGDTLITYTPSFDNEEKSMIKVKQAIMKLKVNVANQLTEGFRVVCVKEAGEELIDKFFTSASNGNICFDITESLQEMLEEGGSQLLFKIKGGKIVNIAYYADKEVIIKYKYKKDASLDNTSFDVNLNKAGNAKVNLNNGSLTMSHNDITLNGALPFNITHTYSTLEVNKNKEKVSCGITKELPCFNMSKGWRTNLNQYLIKRENKNELDEYSLLEDNETNAKYTYVNGEGKIVEFFEKYYYMDNDNKVYLTKENVKENKLDNTYYYLLDDVEYKVTKEMISDSGLLLIGKLEDSEDIVKLEKELNATEDALKELEYRLDINSKSAELLNEYDKLNAIASNIQFYSNYVDTANIETEKETQNYLKAVHKISQQMYNIYPLKEHNQSVVDLANTVLNNDNWLSVIAPNLDQSNEEETLTIKYDTINKIEELIKEVQYLRSWGYAGENDLGDGSISGILFNREKLNETNIEYYNASMDYQDKNTQYQLDSLLVEKEMLEKQINNYQNTIDTLDAQLSEIKDAYSYYYISDGTISLGFSRTSDNDVFRLINIIDNYQNTITVKYYEDKIKSVVNSENKEIRFEYENDLLKRIIDIDDNKKIRFNYQGGYLTKIIYPNNKSSKYYYDENGLLINVIDSFGYGAIFEYLNNKVTNVKDLTSVKRISKNNKEGYLDIDSDINIEGINYCFKEKVSFEYYDNKCTYVTNDNTLETKVYLFDNDLNVVTIYDNKFIAKDNNSNVNVVSYNKGNKKSLTISSLNYVEELLNDQSFVEINSGYTSESYLGESTCSDTLILSSLMKDNNNLIYTVNNELRMDLDSNCLSKIVNIGTSEFILSGWAKCDSLYANRRLTYYSNNLDDNLDDDELMKILKENSDEHKLNRRFELRAELTYLNNGVTRVDSQYCSFDYFNTNWQYVAFPVTLSEDENDTLVSMSLIFDNTNNNPAQFTLMSLKEGIWEYQEYNDNNLVTYYEDSYSDTIITYEYDENNNLIKLTRLKDDKEQTNEYEYDSYGSLVRELLSDGNIFEYKYNKYGKIEKSYAYHNSNPSHKLYSSEEILNEQGLLVNAVNEVGKIISDYEYRDGSSLLAKEKYIDGSSMIYGYDHYDNKLLSLSINENYNKFGYTDDYLTSLSHNDFDYEYEYDGFSRVVGFKIKDNNYLDIKYENLIEEITDENGNNINVVRGKKVSNTYANGDTFISYYSNKGNVFKVERVTSSGDVSVVLENLYDSYDNLIATLDKLNNVTFEYEYDKLNRISKKKYSKFGREVIITFEYDSEGNLIKETYNFDNYIKEVDYSYNDNRIVRLKRSDNIEEEIEYDLLNRVKQIKFDNGYSSNYEYLTKDDHTTTLIDKECRVLNDKIEENIEYEYDDFSNIVAIKENGVKVVSYTYDLLCRLIREDNKKLNKTVCISYDKGGNILSKREYVYSLEDENNLSNPIITNYSYGLTNNKDRLMGCNDELFEYNNMGNPIVYKNKNLEWDMNNLVSYDSLKFTYDFKGLRTSKTVNNVTTKYYYEGNNLIAQDNGNLLFFNYGTRGVSGFSYTGVGEYYYSKNILGDIIGIRDSLGIEIVRYVYDAYGNHKVYVLNDGEYIDINSDNLLTIEGENNKLIANINPFRYRGYYYDVESKLYYLLSRYYDPSTGRFISMDNIDYLNPDSINGLNLYAYCLNNPVMYTDETGTMPDWLKWVIGGAVLIGIGVGAYYAGGAAAFVLQGALKGALIGAAVGIVVGGIIGGVVAVCNDRSFWRGLASGAATGFYNGVLIGGLIGGISRVKIINSWGYGSQFGNTKFDNMEGHYKKHVKLEETNLGKNMIEYTKNAKRIQKHYKPKPSLDAYTVRVDVEYKGNKYKAYFGHKGEIYSFFQVK